MREEAELDDPSRRKEMETRLTGRLEDRIRAEEARLHAEVCRLFRHDPRSFSLPGQSMLQEDLFSRTTWRVFGLSRTKLAAAAAAASGDMDLLKYCRHSWYLRYRVSRVHYL